MTEHGETQHGDIQHGDARTRGAAGSAGATGNPHVDGVLLTMETLPDLPVDQHVAVFEAAHTGLRQALSDPAPDAARADPADPVSAPPSCHPDVSDSTPSSSGAGWRGPVTTPPS